MKPILEYFGIKAYLRSKYKNLMLKLFNKGWGCMKHDEWFYSKESAIEHLMEEHNAPRPTAQRKIRKMTEARE